MFTNRPDPFEKHVQREPLILLVEDDESDVLLVRRVLRKRETDTTLLVARDGAEALEIMRDEEHMDRPKVVVTDLNMPGMSGHDLIEAIRLDPHLQKTVIFVLSSSSLSGDIERAYSHHVAGYLTKKASLDHLSKNLGMIFDFCEAVQLPA